MVKPLKKTLRYFALLAECRDLRKRILRMEKRLNHELHADIGRDVCAMPQLPHEALTEYNLPSVCESEKPDFSLEYQSI